MNKHQLKKLERLSQALDLLPGKFVFTGREMMPLYLDQFDWNSRGGLLQIQCITDAPTMAEFMNLDRALRKLGFVPKYLPSPPVIDWEFQDMTVSIFPLQQEFLGWNYKWCEEGVFHARKSNIPFSQQEIRVMPPSYFLANLIGDYQKIEKKGTIRLQKLRQIADILLYRKDMLEEVNGSFYQVRQFIKSSLDSMRNGDILEHELSQIFVKSKDKAKIEAVLHKMIVMAEPVALSTR
ncbi:MAG: hypothetical protein AAFY71_06420 [Bacteroidota bacterium]